MAKPTIRELFHKEDADRQWHLKQAREAALLCDVTACPPRDWQQQTDLPAIHQDIGPLGIANMESVVMSALFPPGLPWAGQMLPPDIEYDPRVSAEEKEQWNWELRYQDVIIQSALEGAGMDTPGNLSPSSFHSSQQRAVRSLLITGDCLEQFTDDLRLRTIRLDHYTTQRDSCCNVLSHTIWEKVDPLTLTQAEWDKSGWDNDDKAQLKEMAARDRLQDLYTRVEWQPWTRKWVICQETNQNEISERDVSAEDNPYIPSSLRLVEGFNYGLGFIDRIRAGIRSYDAMMLAMKQYAGQKAKLVPAIDHASPTREKDLLKPSGQPVRMNVKAGVVQDVAFLSANMPGNMSDVFAVMERIRGDLGVAMLLPSESVRNSERTTALEVQAVINQINQATGGYFTPMADMLQRPKFEYARSWVKRKHKGIFGDSDLPAKIEILTGARAIARQNRVQSILTLADVFAKLGPEAQARLDVGVVASVLARYLNITEPGMVKSDEKIRQEQKQAMDAQNAAIANQSFANVAEQVAVNQLTPQQ